MRVKAEPRARKSRGSSPRKSGRAGAWTTLIAPCYVVEVGDRRLLCTMHERPDGWAVVAVEARVPEARPTEERSYFPVDHAHKFVGLYPGEVPARAAAESFANAWVRGFKAAGFRDDRCDCESIEGFPEVRHI